MSTGDPQQTEYNVFLTLEFVFVMGIGLNYNKDSNQWSLWNYVQTGLIIMKFFFSSNLCDRIMSQQKSWYLYPPYPKDRGMLWFYVKAARHPPPAARRPQWC